ncbi:XIAP-associated factor 1 isoform X2 [Octodon degus]|uniref:XIAP-associated factor 1 isoform X2 n=1 Tax=Octodon degus TaxID=10160 RepID=A0A6P6F386_OCTDE|nr:XIAP-associated factor 1 isoform X2 [Octodon degus]
MEEDFQTCGNCKKSVPSSHFILHEAHCLRFLVPRQKKPVPGVKMQEHCEPRHLQTEECLERLVECQFCELTMHLSKLETHESHCGNQTKRCPHCDELILFWLLDEHKNVCQHKQAPPMEGKRTSDPESKIYCNYCNKIITGSKHSHYMDDCSAASEPLRKLLRSFPSRTGGNQTPTAERDVRPKTKSINGFPFLSENSTKQTPSDTDGTLDLPSKSELNPWVASPVENEATYDMLSTCSQCGILLPLPTLNQHQVKCRQFAASKGKQVRKSS